MPAVVWGPVVTGWCWLWDCWTHSHTVRLFGSQTVILLECLNVRQSYCNNVILSDCKFFSLSDYPTFRLSDCLTARFFRVGLTDCQTVSLKVCKTLILSDCQTSVLSDCQYIIVFTVRPKDLQPFSFSDFHSRIYRLSDYQTFRPSNYQNTRMSECPTVRPNYFQAVSVSFRLTWGGPLTSTNVDVAFYLAVCENSAFTKVSSTFSPFNRPSP